MDRKIIFGDEESKRVFLGECGKLQARYSGTIYHIMVYCDRNDTLHSFNALGYISGINKIIPDQQPLFNFINGDGAGEDVENNSVHRNNQRVIKALSEYNKQKEEV